MSKERFVELRRLIAGNVLVPGDVAFEDAQTIWNARLNRMPAAIVRCKDSSDVAASVNFVRKRKIPFAVRSGGHSYAGLGTCEGGVIIDLSQMNSIRIDQATKTGYAGPGVTWGQFYEACTAENLATPGPTVNRVGIAGSTLGGGGGWLSRKYGLALDNLISVEIVTAAGDVLKASETTNPDLFWGVRGGAGNFCIATGFEFQLHEIPAVIFAGQIIYPFKDAERVLKIVRDKMPATPEEFMCYSAMIRIPPIAAFPDQFHGQVAVDLVLAYFGEISQAERVIQPFRKIAEPILDAVEKQSYMDLQQCFDAGTPAGMRWYSQAQYLKEFSDPAIVTLLRHTKNMPGAFTFAYFGLEDGAISRVDRTATAFPHRNPAYDFHILAGWTDSKEDAAMMEWARSFNKEMAQYSNAGVYVNLLAEDEPERIRAAYGDNYRRLVELKRKWDPENLFRRNQNIPPSN